MDGDGLDSSGNNRNGVPLVSWHNPGYETAECDGTQGMYSRINKMHYMSIQNSPAWDFINGNDLTDQKNFTFVVKMIADGDQVNGKIAGVKLNWQLWKINGKIVFKWDDNVNYAEVATVADVDLDDWTTIQVSRAAQSTPIIYINGEAVSTTTTGLMTTAIVSINNWDLRIGSNGDQVTGIYDYVAVYDSLEDAETVYDDQECAPPIIPGLIAHYAFEDANDLGFNSANATLNQGTASNVSQVTGAVGNGAEFDGVGSNSYIEIPGTGHCDATCADTTMKYGSLSFFYKTATEHWDVAMYVFDSRNGAVSGRELSMLYEPYRLGKTTMMTYNYNTYFTFDPADAAYGFWHHFVINRFPNTSGSDTTQVWIDGYLIDTQDTTIDAYDWTGSWFIGTFSPTYYTDYQYYGKLDEFKVFGNGLTEEQILQLCNEGASEVACAE